MKWLSGALSVSLLLLGACPDDASDDGLRAVPKGEGERCSTEGSCAEGLNCFNLAGENAAPSQVCLRACTQDADCEASTLNPAAMTCGSSGLCIQEVAAEGGTANFLISNPSRDRLVDCQLGLRPVQMARDPTSFACRRACVDDIDCEVSELNPRAGTCSSSGVCVQELKAEGEIAKLIIEEVSDRLSDCLPGLQPFVGLQLGLEASEFSCVRRCAADDDCPTPSIDRCNINTGALTDGEGQISPPGICGRGPGQVGTACSSRDPTRACTLDRIGQGVVVCADYFEQSVNQELGDGTCVALCGDVDNDPVTAVQSCPMDTQRCATGFLENTDLGICSDECSAFPSNCTRAATSCVPITRNGGLDNPDLSLCLTSVDPRLVIYDLGGMKQVPPRLPTLSEDCSGRAHMCPEGSFCWVFSTDPGTGRADASGCVYGCDPGRTDDQQGCANRVVGGVSEGLICRRLQTSDPFGGCSAP